MANPTPFYVEAICELFSRKTRVSYDEIFDSFIEHCYSRLVTRNDENLIRIGFNNAITQSELDKFLASWDIEVAGSDKALLLSYLMRLRPDLKFNDYTAPRLKGLVNYNRFANLKLIAKYTSIVKRLNDAGIVPIVVKGGAMKFLRPELIRNMGDIDILVSDKRAYKKSKKLVKAIGYEYADNEHSIDLHEKGSEAGVLDIHLFFDLGSKYDYKAFNARMFAAAKIENVFNTKTAVPCDEDLFFISLVNMARNLRDKTSVTGVLYTIFDLKYLSERSASFDWDRVRENIRLTNTEPQVLLAQGFLKRLVGRGACPQATDYASLVTGDIQAAWQARCRDDIFYSLYVYRLRVECKKLRLGRSLKSWNAFKHYVKTEVPHFFLKRLRKNKKFVYWSLNRKLGGGGGSLALKRPQMKNEENFCHHTCLQYLGIFIEVP